MDDTFYLFLILSCDWTAALPVLDFSSPGSTPSSHTSEEDLPSGTFPQ